MTELLFTEYDHKMIEKITGWELKELKVFYRNKVCSYAVINPYLQGQFQSIYRFYPDSKFEVLTVT